MNSSNRRFDGTSEEAPSSCWATASIVAVPLFVVLAALYPGGGNRISEAGIDEAGTARIREKRRSVVRMIEVCSTIFRNNTDSSACLLHNSENSCRLLLLKPMLLQRKVSGVNQPL